MGYCRYCWYTSVTCLNPQECSKCVDDWLKCKESIDKAKKGSEVDIEIKCCIWCCWYDWFNAKRQSYAKNKLIKINYITKLKVK